MKTVSRGIVLRNTEYGDTSIIARVFTDNHGIRSFLIKGARGKRKKTPYLQPLALVEIEFHYHPAKELLMASSVKNTEPYHHISSELNKSFVCLFLNELLNESLSSDHADEDLFEFIRTSMLMFDLKDWNPNFHLYFMIALTRYFGFYPLMNESPGYFNLEEGCFTERKPACTHFIDGRLSFLLHQFCIQPAEKGDALKITRAERSELTHQLVKYFQIHNSSMRPIRSLAVLSEVLNS
jgi:DNA repair protein RecO (recombination protein O)